MAKFWGIGEQGTEERVMQDSHRLVNEGSLKMKYALKSTGESL